MFSNYIVRYFLACIAVLNVFLINNRKSFAQSFCVICTQAHTQLQVNKILLIKNLLHSLRLSAKEVLMPFILPLMRNSSICQPLSSVNISSVLAFPLLTAVIHQCNLWQWFLGYKQSPMRNKSKSTSQFHMAQYSSQVAISYLSCPTKSFRFHFQYHQFTIIPLFIV